MKLLVTGGMGFIGSHFIRKLVKEEPNWKIINLDKLNFPSNPRNVSDIATAENYQFFQGDICDDQLLKTIFSYGVDIVVNFAAESHVDRSILNPTIFLTTNIVGTQRLLEAAVQNQIIKFIQISTDEVYGSIQEGSFLENAVINPSSPYSASKAAADLMVLAYNKTYGLNVNIVRGVNNYGPMQYPEKLIPKTILKAVEQREIPLYGDGQQQREWIYVEDFCEAIKLVLLKGEPGAVYNAGSGNRLKNYDLISLILKELDKDLTLIKRTIDRPGHDFRYAVNSSKIQQELGWAPKVSFEEGLTTTLQWYLKNKNWWEETT